MENKNVIAVKKYILSLNIDFEIKKSILNEFDEFINSLKSFYEKILLNNQETAEMYIKINCDKFKKNLDTFVFSNSNPTKHIEYIKKNISKQNEKRIVNDRLEEIYNLIKTDTLKKVFYKKILTCSSMNYDTICIDIMNLATFLGYNDEISDIKDKKYNDLDIELSTKKGVISTGS